MGGVGFVIAEADVETRLDNHTEEIPVPRSSIDSQRREGGCRARHMLSTQWQILLKTICEQQGCKAEKLLRIRSKTGCVLNCYADQGYGRGSAPIFTGVFELLARVALSPTDEDGLGTCFGAA